jgi:AcrR family transcriptional regulator
VIKDSGARGARRRRAPKGEGVKLREEILNAAERLLVQTGSEDSVSVRAIADEVGITPPSIYMHFDDKESLLNEVCERRFADLNAAFERAYGSEHEPVAALRALGRAYGEFALTHPDHYRILMMTTSSHAPSEYEDESSQGRRAFTQLVDAVRACIDSGAFPPSDPAATAVSLWAGVHGLVSLLITSPSFPWPASAHDMIENLLDSQLRGLLKNPADRPSRPLG